MRILTLYRGDALNNICNDLFLYYTHCWPDIIHEPEVFIHFLILYPRNVVMLRIIKKDLKRHMFSRQTNFYILFPAEKKFFVFCQTLEEPSFLTFALIVRFIVERI